jgi:hypothetical protein
MRIPFLAETRFAEFEQVDGVDKIDKGVARLQILHSQLFHNNTATCEIREKKRLAHPTLHSFVKSIRRYMKSKEFGTTL